MIYKCLNRGVSHILHGSMQIGTILEVIDRIRVPKNIVPPFHLLEPILAIAQGWVPRSPIFVSCPLLAPLKPLSGDLGKRLSAQVLHYPSPMDSCPCFH